MRELNIGTKKYTKVIVLDEKGAGNANHEYKVIPVKQNDKTSIECFAQIDFQNGAIKETGVNGCQNEDLIAIVIDRLLGFQSGDFSCRENALAITKLEEALLWLRKRTMDREDRNVEGTSIK